MDRMTISGRDGSPKYQVYEDVIVEIEANEANKGGWMAHCSEYPECVSYGRTADEALDALMPMLRSAKDKERNVN